MYDDRIKRIRAELRLSVSKLSKIINVPERTIVSYENEGRTPSLDFLSQLCKELNVNPYWFLYGDGEIFNGELTQYAQFNKTLEQIVLNILKKNEIIK